MADLAPFVDVSADIVRALGPAGLFLASFLAATLLPLSSEVAVVVAVSTGMGKIEALVFASAGNGLACLFNYGLGYAGGNLSAERIRSSRVGSLAWRLLHRHGWVALLASWLPVIGDPITVIAGLVRLPLPVFVAITIPLRIIRYAVILWGMHSIGAA